MEKTPNKRTDNSLIPTRLKPSTVKIHRLSLSDRIQKTKLSKLPVITEWEQLLPISKEI